MQPAATYRHGDHASASEQVLDGPRGLSGRSEQDAEIAKGGDKLPQVQRDKIVERYTKQINEEVNRVQKIADKFNAELKAFKAKNPAAPSAQ